VPKVLLPSLADAILVDNGGAYATPCRLVDCLLYLYSRFVEYPTIHSSFCLAEDTGCSRQSSSSSSTSHQHTQQQTKPLAEHCRSCTLMAIISISQPCSYKITSRPSDRDYTVTTLGSLYTRKRLGLSRLDAGHMEGRSDLG
jgi:hypothetical protein